MPKKSKKGKDAEGSTQTGIEKPVQPPTKSVKETTLMKEYAAAVYSRDVAFLKPL